MSLGAFVLGVLNGLTIGLLAVGYGDDAPPDGRVDLGDAGELAALAAHDDLLAVDDTGRAGVLGVQLHGGRLPEEVESGVQFLGLAPGDQHERRRRLEVGELIDE